AAPGGEAAEPAPAREAEEEPGGDERGRSRAVEEEISSTEWVPEGAPQGDPQSVPEGVDEGELSGEEDSVAQAEVPQAEEGMVNLNTASFEELRAANLSVTQATRVLAHRERLGGYSSV